MNNEYKLKYTCYVNVMLLVTLSIFALPTVPLDGLYRPGCVV